VGAMFKSEPYCCSSVCSDGLSVVLVQVLTLRTVFSP
jgi:hypothetical protein